MAESFQNLMLNDTNVAPT